ncbi:hypothetical protein [Roseitranquillus sediminis]|nr:hypothetical protein [Roseitranquillus sediminis]MBM9596091.1 hypothetical protein [Roseitranquillus sediminis]
MFQEQRWREGALTMIRETSRRSGAGASAPLEEEARLSRVARREGCT